MQLRLLMIETLHDDWQAASEAGIDASPMPGMPVRASFAKLERLHPTAETTTQGNAFDDYNGVAVMMKALICGGKLLR